MFKIDLDDPTELRLLMTYLNSFALGETTVFLSAHGFHFYNDANCSREANVNARMLLMDDNRRLAAEEREILHGIEDWDDTIFKGKFGLDEKYHYEKEIDARSILALPYWSSARALKVNKNYFKKPSRKQKKKRKLCNEKKAILPKKIREYRLSKLDDHLAQLVGYKNFKELKEAIESAA